MTDNVIKYKLGKSKNITNSSQVQAISRTAISKGYVSSTHGRICTLLLEDGTGNIYTLCATIEGLGLNLSLLELEHHNKDKLPAVCEEIMKFLPTAVTAKMLEAKDEITSKENNEEKETMTLTPGSTMTHTPATTPITKTTPIAMPASASAPNSPSPMTAIKGSNMDKEQAAIEAQEALEALEAQKEAEALDRIDKKELEEISIAIPIPMPSSPAKSATFTSMTVPTQMTTTTTTTAAVAVARSMTTVTKEKEEIKNLDTATTAVVNLKPGDTVYYVTDGCNHVSYRVETRTDAVRKFHELIAKHGMEYEGDIMITQASVTGKARSAPTIIWPD